MICVWWQENSTAAHRRGTKQAIKKKRPVFPSPFFLHDFLPCVSPLKMNGLGPQKVFYLERESLSLVTKQSLRELKFDHQQ